MFKPLDQIAYFPPHTKGDITHPDVEFGFITSINVMGDAAFCRYWTKDAPGKLRTVANSESTNVSMLKNHDSVPQVLVERYYDLIRRNPDTYGPVPPLGQFERK